MTTQPLAPTTSASATPATSPQCSGCSPSCSRGWVDDADNHLPPCRRRRNIVTEHGVAMVAVLDDYPEKVLVMESEQATEQERNYLRKSPSATTS